MYKLKSCSIFLVIISVFLSGFASAEDIRIAVRANKGAQKALAQWQATVDYLNKEIPQHKFILVPFENNSSLNQAISLGNFHFCITNPASGIEHKIRYDAQPLATLINKRQGKGYSKFGTVIFARADRDDVTTLQDLKGKMFTAADELGFGGWRVAWLELLHNDINPYTDFSELHFAGGKQQNVVYEVRDKKVDAGSVRTDMLERMAAAGKIKLNNFKVLAQKKSKDFPFLHSTKLYPEWMFSAVRKNNQNLNANVVKLLFSISKDSPAAINGMYIGWVSPLDYTPVDDLLKELKVGPYDVSTMSPYQRLISQYGIMILLIIIVIAVLTMVLLYVIKLNKNILEAKESLKKEAEISKNLEIQLIQSKRIESLGKLTGGIAHDFNNMLASILGYTELALDTKEVKENENLKRYLSQVVEASGKSSELVTQMLTFSKTEGDDSKKEIIPAAMIIDNIKHLLQPLISKNIALNISNESNDLFINATPILITQIIISLCLNAKDSIAGKDGSITINVKAVDIKEANKTCTSCHQDIEGEYVEFSIQDNGCGIPSENIDRIFEPFFTTKEVGKGTGMGLSVLHGIVHKHQGHILIDSEFGTGTTIKFILPKVNSNKTKPKIKNKDVSLHKNKHIVLVDDELSLTTYLSELLQLQGFRVSSFNDSEQALSYMQQTTDKIDIIITDQSMPNLTGLELIEKLIVQYKSLPIIICSGYNEGLEETVTSKFETVSYINKPIRSDKLLSQIASLLNGI